MREITASPEKYPLCPWRTSIEELIGWDCQFGTIDQTAPWRLEFCSRHVALPAKVNLHDLAFIRRSQDEPSGLDLYATAHCCTDRTNGCDIPNARWNSRLAF
jgi:hypothetical protein